MDYPLSQFVSSTSIAAYNPIHQITSSMWQENFTTPSMSVIEEVNIKLNTNQLVDASYGILGSSTKYELEHNRLADKIQRRLAQNREAARKSRLKKKAYVEQLESCRLKLKQLEQELDSVRQQGLYNGGEFGSNNLASAGSVNSEINTFKIEYEQWVEEQNRQIMELRSVLGAHIGDIQLEPIVHGIMDHYIKLFNMKSAAAKVDVFYVISGMWKTSAERFFLWIGGFRPSELLKVLVPLVEPLTEQQQLDAYNLEKSCQQAEDALSQGMVKLQGMLVDTVATGQLVDETYTPKMDIAMERLEALASFVNQADHVREEALQQMSRILTIRQTSRWLLALGEYFQRLRALSKLCANHPRELS